MSVDPLVDTIVVGDGQAELVNEPITAPIGDPAFDISGTDASLFVSDQGSISAPDSGNTAVVSSGDGVDIVNLGDISGALNGVSSTGNSFQLINTGTISSDSRAVDLVDGDGLNILNSGTILGTGDQRNGTLYINGPVDDLVLENTASGTIDAGTGNLGDAISVQVGAGDDLVSEDINITNDGLLQGRGDGPEVFENGARVAANGSSGLRFFNGVSGEETTVTGSIENNGSITSEVNVGFLGGLVIEDGVAFEGTIDNTGDIFGPRNGLYVGNAEHDLEINNSGLISSGSRAVNLDGDNVTFNNSGTVLGTGDQRNGTIYIDGTGDSIAINNLADGLIKCFRMQIVIKNTSSSLKK